MKKNTKKQIGVKYALKGLECAWKETNFRIHIGAFVCAVIMGFLCNLNKIEWTIIIAVSSIVISLELVNTAVEYICDRIDRKYDEQIAAVKDMAAAAVFVTALGAFFVGLIIFVPKLSIWILR